MAWISLCVVKFSPERWQRLSAVARLSIPYVTLFFKRWITSTHTFSTHSGRFSFHEIDLHVDF